MAEVYYLRLILVNSKVVINEIRSPKQLHELFVVCNDNQLVVPLVLTGLDHTNSDDDSVNNYNNINSNNNKNNISVRCVY